MGFMNGTDKSKRAAPSNQTSRTPVDWSSMNRHLNHKPGCSAEACERWSVAGLAAVLAMAFSVWLAFGASMPADVHQALVVAPSLSAITRTSQ